MRRPAVALLIVQVEHELSDVCTDILEVLDKYLIPSAQQGESKVFYHKMCVRVSARWR